MKYILTYQVLTPKKNTLDKIYQLNDHYRNQNSSELKKEQEVKLYDNFLPNPQKDFYILTVRDEALHLQLPVNKLEEFKLFLETGSFNFTDSQANFRIAQNFAWASQLQVLQQQASSNPMPQALLFLYEVQEQEYAEWTKIIVNSGSIYSAKAERAMLEQKHAQKLQAAYDTIKIYKSSQLPNNADLVGIFNPTTQPKNKCIIFMRKHNSPKLPEAEQLFISSAQVALLGYAPSKNALNIKNYNDFKVPVVHLGHQVMQTFNSTSAQELNQGLSVTAEYIPALIKTKDQKTPLSSLNSFSSMYADSQNSLFKSLERTPLERTSAISQSDSSSSAESFEAAGEYEDSVHSGSFTSF